MNVEREIKFRLSSSAARRVWRLVRPATPPERRSVYSVYYDTSAQNLRRAGMALRVRRDGRRWLQTLKAELETHGGLAVRGEWETVLQRAALELSALPRDEILAGTGMDLERLRSRVRPLFETRFVRRSAMVVLEGDARAELCIDQGYLLAGRQRETIRELELELKAGAPGALMRFVERIAEPLELELEVESKAERGYRLAAGEATAPPRKWRRPALREFSTPGDAVLALVSAALAQAAGNARGVAEGRDPEYLHQLRVGLRRLRSALRAFRALVLRPQAKALVRPLRGLMPQLSAARDWDVFYDWLEGAANPQERSRPGRASLLRAAARRRASARRAAAGVASSMEFQSFVLSTLRWMHETPLARQAPGGRTLAQFGSHALERLHRKGIKRGRHIDWHDASLRHAVRIRIKRLRYACEFFAPCFPQASVRPFLKRLEALQDRLGELNDIAVARRLLNELVAGRTADTLQPEISRARRRLSARERVLIRGLQPAWRELEKRRPFWRTKKNSPDPG